MIWNISVVKVTDYYSNLYSLVYVVVNVFTPLFSDKLINLHAHVCTCFVIASSLSIDNTSVSQLKNSYKQYATAFMSRVSRFTQTRCINSDTSFNLSKNQLLNEVPQLLLWSSCYIWCGMYFTQVMCHRWSHKQWITEEFDSAVA